MCTIERKNSGYLLTFSGFMQNDEMVRRRDESKLVLSREVLPMCDSTCRQQALRYKRITQR